MPCFDPIINNDCKINNLNLLSLRSKEFSHDVTAVLFGSSLSFKKWFIIIILWKRFVLSKNANMVAINNFYTFSQQAAYKAH